MDVRNKKVVITGASRGIGLGIAQGFASGGAELTLIADDPQVVEAAARIGARGAVTDITDAHAVDRALAPLDRIDVLINNAGLERLTPIAEEGDEIEQTFRRIIEINIIGTQIVTAGRCAAWSGAAPSSTPPRSGAAWQSRCSEPMSLRSTR